MKSTGAWSAPAARSHRSNAVGRGHPRASGSLLLSQPIAALATLVLVLAATLLLREVSSLVMPLLFGAFLALMASPLVAALEGRGVVRPLALAMTVLAVLLVGFGGVALIVLSVGQLLVLVPSYEHRLVVLLDSLETMLEQAGIHIGSDGPLLTVPPGEIAVLVRAVGASVSGAGVALLVLVGTMVYALVGAASLRERAVTVLGSEHPVLGGVDRFGSELRRYLILRAGLGLFAAAASLALLQVLGVPLAALWVFLVFAASFIPNVGLILALIPPAVVALLDSGVGAAVAVAVGYVVINLVQDSVLQPVAFGTELNVRPLVVFASVVLWTWTFGAAGALLAVPLTTGLVAILEAFPVSQRIAALMRNVRGEGAEPMAGTPAASDHTPQHDR